MVTASNFSGAVRFGDFHLDLRTGELSRDHILIKLQPQPAKILVLLVSRAGETVSRQELAEQVWGAETFVDFEQGLNFAIRQIRAALKDDRDHPQFLQTVPRRGYRFVAPVEIASEPDAEEKGLPPGPNPPVAIAAHSITRKWTSLGVLALLAAAVVSAVVYRRATAPRVPRIDVQSMKMTRLTDYGNVGTAAISRDGRHLAYTVGYQQPSLWVQQVGSDSKLQIVPPSPGEIIAVTFSPDGNNLYYVRARKGYVVAALGGTPRPIIEETFGGIGVSPDGRKLAFVHDGDALKSRLIVVNRNGSGEHVIAEHPRLSGTRFNSVAAPSWSPDGKLIALPAIRNTDHVLMVYPVDGSSPRVIPLPDMVRQALWLPDQSGILACIQSSFSSPGRQIWLQPLPEGRLQRLTNDLDGYRSLSLSGDGKLLAAVQEHHTFSTFVGPASNPEQGKLIKAGKTDGIGLAWLPDGTLLSQNVESEFSSLTPDGQRRLTLFKDQVFPGGFSVCGNGSFLVLERSSLGEQQTIWRTNATGHDSKQLTTGLQDMAPDCSPDAQSVIYLSQSGTRDRVMKVPVGGGVPIVLKGPDTEVYGLRYSPDGQKIAGIELDEKFALVVRNAQTGQAEQSFDLPDGFVPPLNSAGWILRWKADGRALTYAVPKGAAVNLWSQPLASGPARQITDFPDEVVAYDWSPDGKQLALTRSAQSRDIVLISNFH